MRFLKICFALGCVILWSRQSFTGDPQWVEIRSPNFSVITDAGDKRGRDVALHFEQMRSVFGTLMTKAHVSQSVPLQIVGFRSSKELRPMAPLFNGKPVEVAGLFQGGDDRSFIMLDLSVENPWTVVFHEYAHQLMNSNLTGRTDPWFEEGFAEYFSSIEVDNKEARVGKVPNDTYLILRQTGLMKVGDLFRVQQNSKTYNESGDHRNAFYAESSLVVHYIFDNKLTTKLAVYFGALIDQKKSVEQATQEAFGMTPAQFDKVLRDYLNSGHYKYYSIPTPSGIVASQFNEAPVSVADAHAALADIDAHSASQRDRALGEFLDVLKTDPNNSSALRGAGYAYLQQQDFEHASQYFRQAAERDSKDPRVHYYNALLMNRAGGAQAGDLKKELETAVALDPNFADAYSLLGYAQATSGEPEKGLRTMEKAVELSPRNEIYQLNLAGLYMANRKTKEAIALFQGLARSGNPEVANRAEALLEQARSFEDQTKSFPPQVENRTEEHLAAAPDSNNTEAASETGTKVEILPPSTPIRFIKGKLAAVDCSAAPQALLSVTSGGRPIKLHVGDTKRLLLMGADEFSCDWKNRSVAVNYRERKDGDGDVVSLELQ